MKKVRASSAACFLGKGKDFVFITGGFGLARRVQNECEIFNVQENYWTVAPAMKSPRASHSILITDNLKYTYVFGGIDQNQKVLDSIERLRIPNPESPLQDISQAQWETLTITLPEGLMNVGCLTLNQKDLLLFGGSTALGDLVPFGRVLTVDSEERGIHSMNQ